MDNIPQFFSAINFLLISKGVVLFILGLYNVFLFILLTNVRSLGKLVHIHAKHASKTLSLFTLGYLIAGVSLFFLALVIL